MGGGFFGYVFAFSGCMFLLLLTGAATAMIYAYARVRGQDGRRVRAVSLHGDSTDER